MTEQYNDKDMRKYKDWNNWYNESAEQIDNNNPTIDTLMSVPFDNYQESQVYQNASEEMQNMIDDKQYDLGTELDNYNDYVKSLMNIDEGSENETKASERVKREKKTRKPSNKDFKSFIAKSTTDEFKDSTKEDLKTKQTQNRFDLVTNRRFNNKFVYIFS